MSIEESHAVALGSQPSKRRLLTKNVSRLIELLVILAMVGAAAVYDLVLARPAVANADKKINELVAARTRLSASQGGFITPADIQQALDCEPTWIERHPDDG